MFELRGVSKQFQLGGRVIRALDDVSIAVARGEFAVLVGPSGSGKSTALSLLGCIARPSFGTVLVDGIDPWRLSDRALSVLRNRRLGFVFQFAGLIPSLSALENVQLPALFRPGRGRRPLEAGGAEADHGRPSGIARAKELLVELALGDRLDARPAQLSGGEQRRVAVARALFSRPDLILADEPTADLDEENAALVHHALLAAHNCGAAVVLVTHASPLALPPARLFRLQSGRLLADPLPLTVVAEQK